MGRKMSPFLYFLFLLPVLAAVSGAPIPNEEWKDLEVFNRNRPVMPNFEPKYGGISAEEMSRIIEDASKPMKFDTDDHPPATFDNNSFSHGYRYRYHYGGGLAALLMLIIRCCCVCYRCNKGKGAGNTPRTLMEATSGNPLSGSVLGRRSSTANLIAGAEPPSNDDSVAVPMTLRK